MENLPTKIYLTIPWFGGSSGGAEVYCRGLAAALRRAGHAVEILTTCCRDPFSDWTQAQLPAGLTQLEGVDVRRFPPNRRDQRRYVELELKIRAGQTLNADEERDWIDNSINSDGLCEFIGRNRERGQFIFLPYLYGLGYFGSAAAGARGWLLPCLHNEGAAYLRLFERMFQNAAGCLFLSAVEMDFARARFSLPPERCRLIRGGIEIDAPGDARSFREKFELPEDYLLYVGRLVPGKGADWLIECYQSARGRLGDALPPLVLIGAGERPRAAVTGVRALGRLSDAEVDGATRGCRVLCQPSFYESFSLVLLNAWRHGRPALVNARCEVLRRHCAESNGGLWFGDPHEFTECLRWLIDHPAHAEQLGAAGREYVRRHFSWEQTVAQLVDFIQENPPAVNIN